MRWKLCELLLLVHIYLLLFLVSSGWWIISTAGLSGIVCFLPLTVALNLTRAVTKFKCLIIWDCEGGNSRSIRNIGKYLPVDTASHTRIFQCSSSFHFFSWNDITFTFVTASPSTSVSCLCVMRYWRKWKTHDVSLLQIITILGAFAKLRKATTSFVFVCLFVHPSAWNNSVPTGRIFIKFDMWFVFENLSRRFKHLWNVTRKTGTLHEDQYTFMIYPA
jgi:hypothetical protein